MKPLLVFSALWLLTIYSPTDGSYYNNQMKLPFFMPIQVPSEVCQSEINPSESGVCVPSRRACTQLNGTVSGTCAKGFGTCCLVTLSCASSPETVIANGTHLVNPPNLKNQVNCVWQLPKREGVCQIKLDFVKYETSLGDQPFVADCQADTLYLAAASNTQHLGALCGNLTGQSVYLDYGNSDTIFMYNYIDQAMNQGWDIRVTYIKCDSPERAPDGCLQYYTDPTGTVMSFNYPNQQLNDQDYTVCIETPPGMSKITWDTCGGFHDFTLSGTPAVEGPPGLPPIGVIPITGSDCALDWVQILGTDKYCGNAFPGPVTSLSQPFILQVHFNHVELEDGDDRNTGFCMTYKTRP